MKFSDHVDEALGLSNAEVTAELRQIELDERALNVRRSALLAAAEAKNIPADDGHASTMRWLVANTATDSRQRATAPSSNTDPTTAPCTLLDNRAR